MSFNCIKVERVFAPVVLSWSQRKLVIVEIRESFRAVVLDIVVARDVILREVIGSDDK